MGYEDPNFKYQIFYFQVCGNTVVVGVCILSGDGSWQVRGVDVAEKGCQGGSLKDAILEALLPPPFAVGVG